MGIKHFGGEAEKMGGKEHPQKVHHLEATLWKWVASEKN